MPRAQSSRARQNVKSVLKYDSLVTTIAEVHERAQAGAAGAVNRYLTLRNWLIGAHIVEFEQYGEDRAVYGEQLLPRLARDLQQRAVPGCSAEMLGRMRLFYRIYPQLRQQIPAAVATELVHLPPATGALRIPSPVVTESGAPLPAPLSAHSLMRLSWTHFIDLIRLDDPWKRAFYENECLKGNWSKRQLQRQIGSLLYERTGLSADKQGVLERARQQAAVAPGDIVDLIRDPYVLEFIGLEEQSRFAETQLETALLSHIQRFLLELGTGFCFEARQKRITVGDEHDYIDLVFYHRLLRCHVLIDLKVRPFQHGDAGQMNFYVNYWKAEGMGPGDNPPVGLLLCSDKNQTKVEYATGGLDPQLFVARYLVALPKPEELRRAMERDRAAWDQQCQGSPGEQSH